MKKNFKEKAIFFLDDNMTKACIALLMGFIVQALVGIFTLNLFIRLFAFYLAYFAVLISLNKYVVNNKKNEK